MFIDFLRQKVIVKYGAASDRTTYVLTFLDSLNKDIQEFLGMDFFELKNAKDLEHFETLRKHAEFLAQKEMLRNQNKNV